MKSLFLAFMLALQFAFSPFGPPPKPVAEPAPDGLLEIHFINVGNGDAILVGSQQHWMMVDAASGSATDEVLSYMDKLGIQRLDRIVATHPHEDHIGGIDDVMLKYKTEQLYLPEIQANTDAYMNMLKAAQSQNIPIKIAKAGDEFEVGSSKIKVLAPVKQKYQNINDNSIVLKITNGNKSFLLTGDIEAIAESDIVEKWGSVLKSDVLKVPHHGAATSCSPKFLKAVSATHGIISVKKDNRYQNPDDAVLSILKSYKMITYRTDLSGNIVLKCDGEGYAIKSDH